MLPFRTAVLFLSCLALGACVVHPLSRTTAESGAAVTISGYTPVGGQAITLSAIDQNTGALVPLGPATSAMSGTAFATAGGQHYTLFPWSFNAGVLAPNLWSPQTIVANLKTTQGHLEIVAAAGSNTFRTFSQEAFDQVVASSSDPLTAGNKFSDGTATVLFDQTGVGAGAAGPWVSVAGMISDSHSPYYVKVAWSVGYYTVEGGKKIYGLICAPASGGPYPVVVYNHGGTSNADGGNVTGFVTATGWTQQPMGAPDGLGQCIDWAKRGWIFAASSYRSEHVTITSSSPSFASGTWTSDGSLEFCLGEVTDVLALTDLVVHHAGAIKLGAGSGSVPIAVNGKLLMYGYSHGGCITHRAVEQGAPVTAYSVIEGFSDMRLAYLTARQAGATPETAAILSGAYQFGVSDYQPDTSGVMGYNWRSAHYFAAHGDLAIRRFATTPILILQGDIDASNPVPLAQAAEIAADIGTTNIFVGPLSVTPPSSTACIDGPAGAPLPPALGAPNKSCSIAFTRMNSSDPCVAGATVPLGLGLCTVVMLPLAPPSGQAQQLHYLVVFHNMNHTNGGLAIKETFNRFAEQNFLRQPGCDGLEIDCAD